MSKFTTDATHVLKDIGSYVWKGAKVIVPIAGMIFLSASKDRLLDKVEFIGEVTYDNAVKAVMQSNMWSSDKTKVLAALKKDSDSEFYKSIIHIVRGSMFSSDKVKLIIAMSE